VNQNQVALLSEIELLLHVANRLGANVSIRDTIPELATLIASNVIQAHRLLAKELRNQTTMLDTDIVTPPTP
jgi:hypothetical protein